MRANAQRRWLTQLLAAAVILPLCWQPTSATTPEKGVLEEWDHAELTMRQGVWRLYAASHALGKDTRGRTVADDLAAWIMSSDVRAQLRVARGKAEHQQQAGDTDGAYATWSRAKTILDEQTKRLTVVSLYWFERIPLERQRALWLNWVSRAPDDVAKASKDRINSLANQLVSDFAPTVGLEALGRETEQLKKAYDKERRKLAALAHQAPSGESLESSDRSIPCTQVTAPGAATALASPSLLASPSAEKLYPPDALRDLISGDVVLEVTVGIDGCMQHAAVVTSSGAPELDESALQLVQYATFRPAEVAGRPVAASLPVKYRFTFYGDSPGTAPVSKPDKGALSHVSSASALLDRGAYDQAIAELDQAIELDPDNAMAFADRAMAYLWKGQDERAKADLAKASTLDPENFVIFHGRGVLAMRADKVTEAIAAFSEALTRRPGDAFALKWRGDAYFFSGDPDRAARDNGEVIRITPGDFNAYVRQAQVLRALHKPDEAVQQAEAVMKANPGSPYAALSAGYIYAGCGKQSDALHAFDRAIELGGGSGPEAYLARAQHRPRDDLAGRRADIEAALVRSPDSIPATILLADLQSETGDTAGAIATLSDALVTRHDDDTLLTRRAIGYLKNHQDTLAEQDLGKVTERAQGNAHRLNSLCWTLARAEVALERALKACNDAVAADPRQAAFLDSLGFVLFKSGRDAEALAAYNHALERRPLFPMSLYGRGMAKRRQGDLAGGAVDIASAAALDPRIADRFTGLVQ